MSVSRPAAVAALLTALLGSSSSAWAACYTVYGPGNEVIYRDTVTPVDLSYPLSQTLPRIAPGATLVFTLENVGCEVPLNKLPVSSPQPQGKPVAPDRPVSSAQRS